MVIYTFSHHMAIASITCILAGVATASSNPAAMFESSPIVDHFEDRWSDIESFEKEKHMRAAQSHHVEYGGNHPFEILEKRRLHQSITDNSIRTLDDSDERQLSPWSSNAVLKPIRLYFDTTYIEVMKDSAQYSEHIIALNTDILPRVVQRWKSALTVFRSEENIIIKSNQCPHSSPEQLTTGIPNSDLVVFIAANFEAICQDSKAVAASRSCQADQYDKPTVGSIILCLDRLDVNDEQSKNAFYYTIIHEMSHVLGMRAIDFPFFYDHATGLPRTPRPFEPKQVTCVDGNVVRIAPPSSNTLKAGYTGRGNLYYEIVTPTVRQVVRNHFNCQIMGGARLENQPTNDGNCFGSHWEARLFATDVVAAIKVPIIQMLTPLTLALLEDSGWYKSEFDSADISPFGHGRGCDFVFEDCIVDGNVPEWGKGTFCDELNGLSSTPKCDISHNYITRCDLVDYDFYPASVPPDRNHQYFPSHPTWGGIMHTADYCPMNVIPLEGTNSKNGVFEFNCSNDTLTSDEDFEYFGDGSRCIETNMARPLCMRMVCDPDRQKVVIFANNDQIVCQNDGDFMAIPGSGSGSKVQCPILNIACPNFVCPSNCRGRGICDFSQDDPFCRCCNSNDSSEDCRYSETCDMVIGDTPEGNFFCGSSSFQASSCPAASECPGGKDSECGSGELCYDVLKCKVHNYHCGRTVGDAAQCSTECPSGSDDQCPMGETCYDVPICNGLVDVDGEKYCGETFQDASQCLAQCRSDGECPAGHSCFVVSNCFDSGSKYCGVSPADATNCESSCPNGHVDCAANELCYVVDTCENAQPDPDIDDPEVEVPISKYCGLDIHDAAQCGQSCENDVDCSGGESCIGIENCNQFCGSTWTSATQCSLSCPSGRNSDCPTGEQCFEVQSCNMYCGSTIAAASTCGLSCPSGNDNECPIGDSCHLVGKCNMFCGSTLTNAASCSQSCPSGTDSECGPGKQCMEIQSCNMFCGSSLAGASQCSQACPSGEDSECPLGEQCQDVQNCNKFCGSSPAAASECSMGCPSGLDIDCPFGQQCLDVQECNMYCGSNISAASTCGISCPSGSDSECPSGDSCRLVENCNKFCGDSLGAAASCSLSCPSASDQECPGDEQCYAVDQCLDPEGEGKLFFCGGADDPDSCRAPGKFCADQPSGGCGAGEYCFYDPPCNDNIPPGGNYFCGENLSSAIYCTQACPSGLNGECPYGQRCYNVDTCSEETMSPTASPTAKPRLSVMVSYTFCLEHGLLTPPYKLERNTSQSISKTLISKFLDNTQQIDAKWQIDETHLTVRSVETTWLEMTPEFLDCKCDGGDESSTCSPVESEAIVEFWDDLDPDMMRYLLLEFQPSVTNEMRYKATYWGFVGFESDKNIQLYGVPEPVMPAETKTIYEGVLKEYLNEDLQTMNIPGLEVLIVLVNSVQKLKAGRRSLTASSWDRSLGDYGVDVVTTVAGQYIPPPEVDLGKLIGESLERGSKTITKELKQSGDAYFENLIMIVEKEDSEEEDRIDDIKRKSKSKVGIIFGVLFLILFLVVLAIVAIMFYRRKKEKEHETQNMMDNETFVTNDYGDFYGKDSANYTLDGSVMTDPTYRGGTYEKLTKDEHDEEQFYEDEDEDIFDDEDAGTFTGQQIRPNDDDVSALMSVRGVEDGWTTEASKTDTDYETATQSEYESADHTDYESATNTDYESATLPESQAEYTSEYHSRSDSLVSRGTDAQSNYDGYQSQGTGYHSRQSEYDDGYTSNYTSKSAHEDNGESYSDGENTYEDDDNTAFLSMASAPNITNFSKARVNIGNNSAPTIYGNDDLNFKMLSTSSPNLMSGSRARPNLSSANSLPDSQLARLNQSLDEDECTQASDLQSYASAPTVFQKQYNPADDCDDFSLISMDSFATAPTVMVERPAVSRAASLQGFGMTPIEEGTLSQIIEEEEPHESIPSILSGDKGTHSLASGEELNEIAYGNNAEVPYATASHNGGADENTLLNEGTRHSGMSLGEGATITDGSQYSGEGARMTDGSQYSDGRSLGEGARMTDGSQYYGGNSVGEDTMATEGNGYYGGNSVGEDTMATDGNGYHGGNSVGEDTMATEGNGQYGGNSVGEDTMATEVNQYGHDMNGAGNSSNYETENAYYSGHESQGAHSNADHMNSEYASQHRPASYDTNDDDQGYDLQGDYSARDQY